MLNIYLDGHELKGGKKKYVVDLLNSLNHVCSYCAGSFIKMRRILIYSDSAPITFFYWCSSCGKLNRIVENLSNDWYQRITGNSVPPVSQAG